MGRGTLSPSFADFATVTVTTGSMLPSPKDISLFSLSWHLHCIQQRGLAFFADAIFPCLHAIMPGFSFSPSQSLLGRLQSPCPGPRLFFQSFPWARPARSLAFSGPGSQSLPVLQPRLSLCQRLGAGAYLTLCVGVSWAAPV